MEKYKESVEKSFNELTSKVLDIDNDVFFRALCNYEISKECENRRVELIKILKTRKNLETIKEHNTSFVTDKDNNIVKTIQLVNTHALIPLEELRNHSFSGENDRLELHLRDNGELMILRHKFVNGIYKIEKTTHVVADKSEYELINDNIDIFNTDNVFTESPDNINKTLTYTKQAITTLTKMCLKNNI